MGFVPVSSSLCSLRQAVSGTNPLSPSRRGGGPGRGRLGSDFQGVQGFKHFLSVW